MDDAGALDAAYSGELAIAVVEEGVDEGAVWIPRGGVHDHAVGFVDDDDVGVLEEDVEGDVLGGGDVWDGLGNYDRYSSSGFYAVAGFGGLAVDEDVLLTDEDLDTGAGEICEA